MNYQILVQETKSLCQKEIEINAQIIRNLIEINKRRIHLEMGYGSLFEFCTIELGLSPSSTQRKIDAVRLSQSVPDLVERIEKKEISLNKVSQVSKFIREEKKQLNRSFSSQEVQSLVSVVQAAKSEMESQKILSQKSEMPVKPIEEKVRVVSQGRQIMQIEADDELINLLKKVRDLLSHQGHPSNGEVIIKTLKFFLSKKHPTEKLAKSHCRAAVNTPQTRFINLRTREIVWRENQGMCSYTDPLTKKRCNSTFRLQVEHIKPFAHGGLSTRENLTLYCQSHNLFAANKLGLLRRKPPHENQNRLLLE